MRLKKPYNYVEQVKRLQEEGIIVREEKEALEFLKEVNYYRLSGYALQFRVEPQKSFYQKGTTFEEICDVYKFDEEIRNILKIYLEKVEIYFRTQISNEFSLSKCLLPPHNQHYDENNFFDKKKYRDVMEKFEKERGYYKDSLVVEYHKEKYRSRMPLWVMVEFISFSNLSKLYNCMYISEKERIANQIGISRNTLTNQLHCLSVLRNKCAHAVRLYNKKFNPPVRFTKQFSRKHKNIKNDSLFAYLLILVKRLPCENDKEELINQVNDLIKRNNGVIDKSLIGFPNNYLRVLKNAKKS